MGITPEHPPTNGGLALTVALAIERERRTTGRGLTEIAAAAGISQPKLSRLVNNQQTFRIDELFALEGVLGVKAEELIARARQEGQTS
jgi:transcriptional regulator with XRE-family HTH domain